VLVPETIPKPAEGSAGFRYMARFVTLLWIPSHQGIKGNETADQAAQQQQKSINSLIWLRKPGTEGDESRNYAMHRLLEKNGRIYGLTAHMDNFIVKSNLRSLAKSNTRTPVPSRAKEVTMSRLRYGKCRLNDYLHNMKATDSEKCNECSVATETVEHIRLSKQRTV